MTIDNYLGVNESLSEFGLRIKEIRIGACLTQKDLAEKAGVSLSTIRRIEDGQTVQFENILRVLKALNLLSKLEMLVPSQRLTPMQLLEGEKKKKTYRKSTKKQNNWTWDEEGQ